jgi:hypothetical protein
VLVFVELSGRMMAGKYLPRGTSMSKKKDKQESGSMDKTPDREFETQGNNPSSGKGGQQAGVKQAGSQPDFEDDGMTSGGRKGNFSDKDRENQSQWSPGSSQSSDQ